MFENQKQYASHPPPENHSVRASHKKSETPCSCAESPSGGSSSFYSRVLGMMKERPKHVIVESAIHRRLKVISATHGVNIEDFVSQTLTATIDNENKVKDIVKLLKP